MIEIYKVAPPLCLLPTEDVEVGPPGVLVWLLGECLQTGVLVKPAPDISPVHLQLRLTAQVEGDAGHVHLFRHVG